MEKTELKQAVYSIFTDTFMLVLALIALPVTIAEFFLFAPTYLLILTMIDWVIWLLFLLEFVLKVYSENNYTTYIKMHKGESALSIIIIGSPIAVILTQNLIPLPAFGLVRALRIFRVLGYGDEAYAKRKLRRLR